MSDNELDDESEVIDEYLDCTGRVRTFRLVADPATSSLDANEVKTNGEPGLRFTIPTEPGLPPRWFEMRNQIRERLAHRHIVRMGDGRLEMLSNKIRGQMVDNGRDDADAEPVVVVDDMTLTWTELGRILSRYAGWGLRLEVTESGQE